MRDPTVRRVRIIEELCKRRSIQIVRLASEFSVHRSTIQKDIEVISTLIPIYTTRGNDGGVHVMDGFYLGMKYLTEPQAVLLEKNICHLGGRGLNLNARDSQNIQETVLRPIRADLIYN